MTGLLHSMPRSIALLLAGCALLVWALAPVLSGDGAPQVQAQSGPCTMSFGVDAPGVIDAAPGDQFSFSYFASITVIRVTSISLAVSPGSAPGLVVSSSPAQTSIEVSDPQTLTTYEVPGTISVGVPFDASGGSYLVSGINASAVCQLVGGGSANTSAAGSTIQVNVIEPTPTPTATDVPTPTSTATDVPSPTPTNIPSPTPTATSTATSAPTATTPPSATATATSTATSTSPPTASNTATATGTASPTSPNAATPTPSPTGPQPPTSTATGTPTPTPTGTQSPTTPGTPTATATGTITSTPSGTVSPTPSASGTATRLTGSPTATVTGTPPTDDPTSDDLEATEDVDTEGAGVGTSTPEGEVESAESSLVLDFTEERAVVLVEEDQDRSWLQIGAGLLGLVMIAGGGFGVWRGREPGL